ncbi:MAG: hypothetical protein IPL61_26465 [Myxococcales bacterium]|nr:hypothetical protein [Myxococcales bacterium]
MTSASIAGEMLATSPGGRGASLSWRVRDVDRRAADERRLPGEQLVRDDPDRVQIGGHRRGGAADQLGRHVLGRAADVAVLALARGVDQPGDPEVHDLDLILAGPALLDQDVVALEVGVDHAREVGLLDAGQDLVDDRQHPRRRQRVLLGDQVRQRRAAQVLHDQVQEPVAGLAVVDDRHGVGVVEAARGQRLVLEPLHQPGVARQILVEDLHRHGAT